MLGQVAQRLLRDSIPLETFKTRWDEALNTLVCLKMSLFMAFKGHLVQSKPFCDTVALGWVNRLCCHHEPPANTTRWEQLPDIPQTLISPLNTDTLPAHLLSLFKRGRRRKKQKKKNRTSHTQWNSKFNHCGGYRASHLRFLLLGSKECKKKNTQHTGIYDDVA